MSEVLTFKLRKFQILFNMPDKDVIRLHKTRSDKIDINIDGKHGTAILEATTKRSAENKLLRIFPDSVIIQTTYLHEI